MRQDSDSNIIVLNTALKYKIPSRKKNKLQRNTEPVQRPERSIACTERLKAFTDERLVTSFSKLFQTLITRSEISTDRVGLLQSR